MELCGNGTRDSSNEYVLVGDRNIQIDKITAIMEVEDVEEIEVKGNPFNVFRETQVSKEEYEWEVDDSTILEVENGVITAKAEGTAHITVKDKLTNRKLVLTRVVLEKARKRIEEISVNGVKAELDENATDDNLIYRVKIVTDDLTGLLKIITKNKTDKISIDEGINWQENGNFQSIVDLPNKITQIPIKIGIQNNQGDYPLEENATLIVEKLTDDTSIQKITATSNEQDIVKEIEAIKVLSNRYEVVISDETNVTDVKALLNCEYSEVSIDGIKYSKKEQIKPIVMGDELSKEIKIKVKSEAGNEEEYTLAIYKQSLLTKLIRVTVDGEEASKITEEEYQITVSADKTQALVKAKAYTHLTEVSVNGNEYKILENQANVELPTNETEVIIKTKANTGEEKEYKLKIIKKSTNTNLTKVMVDGEEASIGEDGKYHYSLTKAQKLAVVTAYTEDEKAQVKIEDNEYNLKEDTKPVEIFIKETEVKISVKAENGETKEHILVIHGLSDDVTIKQVVVNGETAEFVEGENRYEIRLAGDTFDVEVTLNDALASMELGTNPEKIGVDSITLAKTGEETQIKVKVISQSKLVEETYTIAILEKSRNTELETVTVNGKKVTKNEQGEYRIGLPANTEEINACATAEDIKAQTTINGSANNTHIANITETVVDGKEVYEYTIQVTSEAGDVEEHKLYVEILEANYGIIKVEVGEDEINLEEAVLEEDGNYHMKIANVEEEYVKVTLESEKSKVKINGVLGDLKQEHTYENVTTIPIEVIAEDGTSQKVNLILEKKSNDTSIKTVEGEKITKCEIEGEFIKIYTDEDTEGLDMNIILNSKFGSLKLETDVDYETYQITRSVDLSTKTTMDITIMKVNVKAEDGTEKTYELTIYKQADVQLKELSINGVIIEYNEEKQKYEAVLPNGNTPAIIAKAKNEKHTVALLNSSGGTIASSIGTLTRSQTLSNTLIDNFKIKVIASGGESYDYKEYDLEVRQKSIETGIIYVKVDNLGTMYDTTTKTYSSEVSGKETYPVEIKLRDAVANVRIEDETGVLIENQQGLLKGELDVPDGEIKDFKVIVTAENGNEEEYTLRISRLKDTTISGKILTENANGEHISKVAVYKVIERNVLNEEGETEKIIEKELYKEVETEPDGTFLIPMYIKGETDPKILEGKYEVVVSKEGYLDYTVQEITLEERKDSCIGEYELIAGDVVKTGEINIDDLSLLNDCYGITITSENGVEDVNVKYDLNGDGIVDRLDRNILKQNYGKLAETIIWEKQP